MSRRALGNRLFGKPPSREAPRVEKLRYLRRFYLRPLPVSIPVIVFAVILTWGTWALAFIAIGVGLWLQGFLSLSRKIRRER